MTSLQHRLSYFFPNHRKLREDVIQLFPRAESCSSVQINFDNQPSEYYYCPADNDELELSHHHT